jgi:hypothetical protein
MDPFRGGGGVEFLAITYATYVLACYIIQILKQICKLSDQVFLHFVHSFFSLIMKCFFFMCFAFEASKGFFSFQLHYPPVFC